MTKREQEVNEQILAVYCGILFNHREFARGKKIKFRYEFKNSAYDLLKSKYGLEDRAGRGGEFERALRLCRWLAPDLTHKGDFALSVKGKDVSYDALALLDYSYQQPEHGINCVAKAKIFAACCLALGIYARRVSLYPASPYDSDNHVVTEVYDRTRGKWIMLDPTTGGYFTDGTNPLSCLEMRACFADMVPVSVVLPRQSTVDVEKLASRNHEWNTYYAKNLFYLAVETVSSPNENASARNAYFVPEGFDLQAREVQKYEYCIRMAKTWSWDDGAIEMLHACSEREKTATPLIGSVDMWNAPA